MDRRELAWRARASVRIAVDRARFRVRRPSWDRSSLVSKLGDAEHLTAAKRAVREERYVAAQDALADHFASRRSPFVLSPARRPDVAARIRRDFPRAASDAAARGNRILQRAYDVLGYRGLQFAGWHHDPVHGRTAPDRFWADVPYLDPTCGDHKIIWELNRHQHFLALGRAHWLTDDAAYRAGFIAELESWLAANPPLAGINWSSMLELALRSLSWIWALHFFAAPHRDDPPWLVDLLIALDRQLRHVERNLSYYFSPNTHLLGEALALYVAGRVLPELTASRRWDRIGRTVLTAEAARQVGADGGHAERSTHYHRYTLDFYLLALAVARASGDAAALPAFERVAAKLAFAARLLADDRGRVPHIGDDDGGVLAPFGGRAVDDLRDSLALAAALLDQPDLAIGDTPEEAVWWLGPSARTAASTRTLPSAALAETGYYVSRSPRGDHLVVDGGPHGYQNGGHAHADALALTYTVAGLPLLIDCGTACYTVDAATRDRFRSSALHNVLVVDDRSQSAPAGPFHWISAADATVHRWRTNDGFDYFDGEQDGYRPLAHRRRVLAMHGDLLVVADLVAGDGRHAAAAHWHVDPRWRVRADASRAQLARGAERVDVLAPQAVIETFSGDAASGLGWHSPVYGRIERATTLRATRSGQLPLWVVTVLGLDPDNALVSAEILPVWAEAGTLDHAIGVRIERQRTTDLILMAEPADATRATWRLAELETDARLLFVRASGGPVTRLALVDGSHVRATGRRALVLELPDIVSDLHVDVHAEARVAGPPCTGRLVVDGREHAVFMERRGWARVRG